MTGRYSPERLLLPKDWPAYVKSAVLHTISLTHMAITHARGWAANSINARVRLSAKLEQARNEIALLREELRIKDARMARIAPQRRPHYPPVERMAILELKAARAWSLTQTANTMLLAPATVASWLKRIDEQGPTALVQLRQPVNKFPAFVRYTVQRLKLLCPTMGKVKIAQALARAGLHLGVTTVRRMLKQEAGDDNPSRGGMLASESNTEPAGDFANEPRFPTRVVTARRPNHVWHVDLTVAPTMAGFWAPWFPFALPQCWPFSWWVAVVIDHFSRRIMHVAVFKNQPTSLQIRMFLAQAIAKAAATPKYVICDKGRQFWCDDFKKWCRRKGIRARFGAVGKHGSIAVIERFIRTMKAECARRLLIPLRKEAFRRELRLYTEWYNQHRPHTALDGRTPNEVYHVRPAANAAPRIEPRPDWPTGAPCASPQAPIRGKPGRRVALDVTFHAGRKHLPIIELRQVV